MRMGEPGENMKILWPNAARAAPIVGPHFSLYVQADQRAEPFERVRENEAYALARARRAVHIDVARPLY